MKNQTKSKLSRRNFLLAVGAGGAATAAAIATQAGGPATAQPATNNNDKRRGRGYQETAPLPSYHNTTKSLPQKAQPLCSPRKPPAPPLLFLPATARLLPA